MVCCRVQSKRKVTRSIKGRIMTETRIAVVGLGYVGLPLAVHFARAFGKVIGYDVNQKRIAELKQSMDASGELTPPELSKANILYTTNAEDLSTANFIVVAVPTPVDNAKIPDLTLIREASETIGKFLTCGTMVVFESTVYPGATEEICVPLIEQHSKLKCGSDWKIGYSPERINPGDKEHTTDKVIKIVAGMDAETTEKLAEVYGKIVKAGIHKAPNIKTAEAAKVIENIQRDLNIALMNELSMIFEKLNIDTKEVLAAAGTKWNFHNYTPGLVGGHCIGVDPYYLTYKAQQVGYHPEVILAGRRINDMMGKRVAEMAIKALNNTGKGTNGAKVLILGLTFKENVRDPRNSRVADIIKELRQYNVNVLAHDPLLSEEQTKKVFNIENTKLEHIQEVDAVILATPHDVFRKFSLEQLQAKLKPKVVIDVKGAYNQREAYKLGLGYIRF